MRTSSRSRGALALLSASTLLAASLAGASPALAADAKITMGSPSPRSGTSPLTAPGVVALISKSDPTFTASEGHFCGGTHISPSWVLTAAHCINPTGPDNRPDVLLGTADLGSGGERITTLRSIIHPDYDEQTFFADVALLELSRPSGAAVQPLAFPGQDPYEAPGQNALIAGWGGLSSDEDNQSFPDERYDATVPVISDTQCSQALAPYGIGVTAPATQICAGGGTAANEEPDACRGDSGGPLLTRNGIGGVRQIGLVSYGPTCGFSPTVYTAISPYLAWIEANSGLDVSPFADTAPSGFQAQITNVVLDTIAAGNTNGFYSPGQRVSRGEMATFLVRALRLQLVPGTRFSDTAGNFHESAINSINDEGIAGGFPDGSFRPDAPVNRDAMAAFISRALELAPASGSRFSDTAGNTFLGQINALADAGVVGGFTDGTYRPGLPVDRGQMAVFLSRAFVEVR